MNNEALTAATDYAKRGWAVLPIVPGTKIPCTKGSDDGSGGVNAACKKVSDVRAYYADTENKNDTAGVAIAMGSVSGGLVAIDIDVGHDDGVDGLAFLSEWESEHGALPDTISTLTPSGGSHLIYRLPDGVIIGNSANGALGVDIKSDGGYIIAWPTVHPDTGTRYQWENHPDDYDVADADDNVLAFIRRVQDGIYVRYRNARNGQYSEKFQLPDSIDHDRNITLHRFACSCLANGMSTDDMVQEVNNANKTRCYKPLAAREIKSLTASAVKWFTREVTASEEPALDEVVVESDGSEHLDPTWPTKDLTLKSDGTPANTYANYKRLIFWDKELHGKFKYAENYYMVIVTGTLPWDARWCVRPIEDTDYSEVFGYIQERYGIGNYEMMCKALDSCAALHRVNPVREWLESLAWDGDQRMDTLLSVTLGCRANDYNVAVTRLTLLGAVARVFEPGIKFDTMTILYGKQGVGKSTLVQRMAHCPEWFTDSISEFSKESRCVEMLRGKWIVEVAELDALKRARDAEGIKAFVSSQYDSYRAPYARTTQDRPRQCVFIGTTNQRAFLTDSTGNRRFLPVECGDGEPIIGPWDESLDDYLTQCWAEAVYVWKTEHPALCLPRELASTAEEVQKSFTIDDVKVGYIKEYLSQLPHGSSVCVPLLVDKALGIDVGSKINDRMLMDQVRDVMDSLKNEGWTRYPRNRGRLKFHGYGLQIAWEFREIETIPEQEQ